MMAKDVSKRFQSAAEVSEALYRWLLQHGGEAWKLKHASKVRFGVVGKSRLRFGLEPRIGGVARQQRSRHWERDCRSRSAHPRLRPTTPRTFRAPRPTKSCREVAGDRLPGDLCLDGPVDDIPLAPLEEDEEQNANRFCRPKESKNLASRLRRASAVRSRCWTQCARRLGRLRRRRKGQANGRRRFRAIVARGGAPSPTRPAPAAGKSSPDRFDVPRARCGPEKRRAWGKAAHTFAARYAADATAASASQVDHRAAARHRTRVTMRTSRKHCRLRVQRRWPNRRRPRRVFPATRA